MATPITHFVLAEKIYTDLFSLFNKKDFLLWNILPDIRYLNVINRSESHLDIKKTQRMLGYNLLISCMNKVACINRWNKEIIY